MKINDIVDKVYFINLDRRPDRLEHAVNQFGMNNIVAERFSATDGNSFDLYPQLQRGAAGCLHSQISIIRSALKQGLSRIAIFEDDVFFVENFESKFSNFYAQVPEDWQFVYLANNKVFADVHRISENVDRVSRAWSAHAFLINESAMQLTIDVASKGDMPIDVYYGILQQHLPAYCATPALAGQRPDHSDIENVFIDYNRIYDL